MKEVEIKKNRFKLLLEGKYVSRDISIKEAKRKLRESDLGIDISEFLRIINSNDEHKFKKFLIEFFTNPDIFIYYMPLLKMILKTLKG